MKNNINKSGTSTAANEEEASERLENLLIDCAFERERVANEGRIANLGVELRAIRTDLSSNNERHDEITAEILKLSIANLLNTAPMDAMLEELAAQIALETFSEDDEETISAFADAIRNARKQ